MKLKATTLDRLSEFLTECKKLFATQTEVSENTNDIDTHLLNVDYSQVEFDTSEIV